MHEENREKWKEIHQKARLCFKFTGFNIESHYKQDLIDEFPSNEKYEEDNGEYCTIYVGDPIMITDSPDLPNQKEFVKLRS